MGLCNKGKKFVARGGWTNYVFPGQTKCNKKREEKNDPNAEELPDKTNDPDAGLPKNPEDFKPVIPMVQSDRRDFHVHARTHKCWRVSCNCAVVVKEGQDVISVNYCGNRNNPFIGFLSKKEPLHGTGIERSGNTYRIVM